MSRRGENIRKRKDGRWEGRYQCGKNADGSPHYRSVYGRTYSEAKNKLIYSKCNETQPPTANRKDITFEEVLKMWMQSIKIKLKGSTENRYENLMETHIIPDLGGYKLPMLTSNIINAFLDKKLKSGRRNGKGGLSPSYVRSMSVIISSAISFAATEGMLQINSRVINKPSPSKKEINILSGDVQTRLEQLSACDPTGTSIGILLALHAGLRIGEVCALKWSDIDFVGKMIHIRHTISRVKCRNGTQKTTLILDAPKTESSVRDIPITSFLYRALSAWRSKSTSDFVVSTEQGFVSTRTFDYRYRRLLTQNKVEIINFHSLRHTFATRCVAAGIDIKTLSEILGHSGVTITLNTYVHPSFEQKRIQMEKLCSCA